MLVVGCVLVVTRACVVSGIDVVFSLVGADVVELGFCNEFSTGIEILALIM